MRYLAGLLILLFALPGAGAQKREIGLSAGIGFPGRFIEGLESWPGLALSVRALTMADPHLQVGIALDQHRLQLRQVFHFGYINGPDQVYYYEFGKPLLSVAGIVNYRIPVRQHYFYLGPAAGYALAFVQRGQPVNYRKGNGLLLGAQAGGVFAWGGGPLALAFEVSPRYYLMTWKLVQPNNQRDTEDRYVLEWNAMLGLRFLF